MAFYKRVKQAAYEQLAAKKIMDAINQKEERNNGSNA